MNVHSPSDAKSAGLVPPEELAKEWFVHGILDNLDKFRNAAAFLFAVLWFRRGRIATICVLAAALAGGNKLIAGPSYTATAVIKPDLRGQETFRGPETSPVGTQVPTVDVSLLVETQTRLIQSPGIARQVVQRLGLDNAPANPSLTSRALSSIRRLYNPTPPSPVDLAVADLMAHLNIKNEKRSYLIFVSYTARRAQEAADVANAVASEFIKSGQRQKLADRYAFAERALTALMSTYGDKHPLILRAKNDVALARAALDRDEDTRAPMNERELAATGLVNPAQANTIPSGMTLGTALILGSLGGLVVAIGITLFFDRNAVLSAVHRQSFRDG